MLSRLKFEISPLVEEMLDQLPERVWRSKTTTFFDPAIGGGQFVAAIEGRLAKYGHSKENIASRVYGCEDHRRTVNYAWRKNNLIGRYWACDFLNEKFDMKFDVIIGNPPYQSPKGTGTQPLWSLFVNRSAYLLNETGVLSFITPNKWCGHTTNVRKENVHIYRDLMFGKLTHVNIQECSKYFPGIGGYPNSFGYFVMDNSGSSSFTATTLTSTYRVNANDFEYLPLTLLTQTTSNILRKVKTFDSYEFSQVSAGFKRKNNSSICISQVQRMHYEKTDIYFDSPTVNINETSKTTVSKRVFTNSSQSKVNKVFRSKLFRFIFKIYWNGDSFGTTFYNSLPFVDLNRTWTDQELYDHFGLTQEEREYIEANIK